MSGEWDTANKVVDSAAGSLGSKYAVIDGHLKRVKAFQMRAYPTIDRRAIAESHARTCDRIRLRFDYGQVHKSTARSGRPPNPGVHLSRNMPRGSALGLFLVGGTTPAAAVRVYYVQVLIVAKLQEDLLLQSRIFHSLLNAFL